MEDINGSRPNAAPKPKKRPNRFVRFLAVLVTLALMVGAVALVGHERGVIVDGGGLRAGLGAFGAVS